MKIKHVNSMIKAGRIDEITQYIKTHSVEGMSFLPFAHLLENSGYTKNHLAKKGAVTTIHDLMLAIEAVAKKDSLTLEDTALLKHYRLVIFHMQRLWEEGALFSDCYVALELDRIAEGKLLEIWRGGNSHYASHLNESILKHAQEYVEAVKAYKPKNAKVSNEIVKITNGKVFSLNTVQHLTRVVENFILEQWENNLSPDFQDLKNYLQSELIETLVRQTLDSKDLNLPLLEIVKIKIKDSILKQLSLNNLNQYPSLLKGIAIEQNRLRVVNKQNLWDTFLVEAVDAKMTNFQNLTQDESRDIRMILTSTVFPDIINDEKARGHLVISDRRLAVKSILDKYRSGSLKYQDYVQYLDQILNQNLVGIVVNGIRNQDDIFRACLVQLVDEDIRKLKAADPMICTLLRSIDLFPDLSRYTNIISSALRNEEHEGFVRSITDLRELAVQQAKMIADLSQQYGLLRDITDTLVLQQGQGAQAQATEPVSAQATTPQTKPSTGYPFGFFGLSNSGNGSSSAATPSLNK